MANVHFFTDPTSMTIPASTNSFGHIASDKFQITSWIDVGSSPVKAFAVMSGQIIIQENSSNSNLVNIILKPLKPLDIPFTSVKYFVYRRVKKDSFLNGNVITPSASTNSELITRLWNNHNAWKVKTNNTNAPDPNPTVFGYDNSLSSLDEIDEIFADLKDAKPFVVDYGMWLGDFQSGEIGFEIVLEEGDVVYPISYLRADNYEVDGTTGNVFEKKSKKEEILNFIDPAAFYGLHYDVGVDISTYSGVTKTISTVSNVYTDLLENKFDSANRVYLDIRNEIGYSYNFYGNYENGGNQIKVGNDEVPPSQRAYNEGGFPIVFLDASMSNSGNKNNVIISLRIEDNTTPLVYHNFKGFFPESTLIPGTSGWTKLISFSFPNHTSGGTKVNVANYLKLHYFRQKDATAIPATVLNTSKYFDNIFGPIDMPRLGSQSTPFKFLYNTDLKYLNGNLPGSTAKFGFVAERGVAFDDDDTNPNNGLVLFYAKNISAYKSTGSSSSSGGISQGISIKNTFFEQSFLNKDIRLSFQTVNDGGNEVVLIKMTDNFSASKEDLILLGLTITELNQLRAVGGLYQSDLHHRYIKLSNEVFDASGNFYKYDLKVQGIDDTSPFNNKEVAPLTNIKVYTKDGLVFTSKNFASEVPFETAYTRNFEELVGAQSKATRTFDIDSVNSANKTITVKPVTGNDLAYYELSINTEITIVGSTDIFTVKSTTKSGNKTIITVHENVPASTTGQISFDLSFEDYFISLDTKSNLGASAPEEFRQLVNDFQVAVEAIPNNTSSRISLEPLVETYGENIFKRAKAFVQDNNYSNPDDRLLYWARLKMGVILKSHPFLLQSSVDKEELIDLFEIKSRNYEGIDFSGQPSGVKRILVTGFDPFFLPSNKYQSNPSGACALALDGLTLGSGPNLGYVQVMMIPVRWGDFDGKNNARTGQGDGIVERFIVPYIGNNSDMIITISQALEGNYNIDRFATINRNGIIDNIGHYRGRNSNCLQLLANEQDLTWIETRLPKAMVSKDDPSDPVPDMWGHYSIYAQAYEESNGTTDIDESDYEMVWNAAANVDNYEPKYFNGRSLPLPVILATKGTIPRPTPNLDPLDRINDGSGGNYMSNEIFYRVALARERWSRANPIVNVNPNPPPPVITSLPIFPTGHFHVALIQGSGKDLNDLYEQSNTRTIRDELTKLIKTVKDRIERGIIDYNDETDLF